MTQDRDKTLEATVPMAIVDAIPVLLFCVSAGLFGLIFKSALFWAGVVCIAFAGMGKVAWKIILAIAKRDVAFLNRQFRYLMGAGFLVCAVAIVAAAPTIDWSLVAKAFLQFPGWLFIAFGFAFLAAMVVAASRLDMTSKHANWIEQLLNIAAQLCLCIGIALMSCYGLSYPPASVAFEALDASNDADGVSVTAESGSWLFDGPSDETLLIFYPGALVDPRAYAPLMRDIAESGVDCVLVDMPYNMALFDVDAAQRFVDEGAYDRYIVGGHSLGGAMAATFAASHADELDGLALLAAYTTKDLAESGLDVVLVRGGNDGVLNMESYEEGLALLPPTYVEAIIEGGNQRGSAPMGHRRAMTRRA